MFVYTIYTGCSSISQTPVAFAKSNVKREVGNIEGGIDQ